jgi:beta-lactam-binding protein with PASTA domain
VELAVSGGPAAFEMPDVVGMTEDQARSALTAKGLAVSVSYEYSTKDSGTVLSQSIPEGDSVTRGTTVSLTVSSGQKTIRVPDVTGMNKTAAENTLRDKGFTVSVNSVYSDDVAENLVISQTPGKEASLTEGSTVAIMVSLGKDTVVSLAVSNQPAKTTYEKGEILNTAGLKLKVNYKSGRTEIITSGFTCSPAKLSTTGTQTITVNYGGKSTTFTVVVRDVSVSTISVKTKPNKLTYYKGDTLNTAGLVLNVTYSNGTTTTVSSGFTCSPTKLSTTGTQTITVTYGGKTTTFTVTVNHRAVNTISVKTKPSKVTYNKDDTLNTAGLVLNVTYSNGTTTTVSSGFTCSPTKLSTTGTQTITVTYGGKTTTFTVTVNPLTVKSISVKTKPSKVNYSVGDTLNTAGLVLNVTYSNGTTGTVSSGFTCSPASLTKAGTQTITVTYGGKTTTFTVNVAALTVQSVSIKTKPNKTTYYVGDTLDNTGLTLTVKYTDGSTKTISSGYTCSITTLNVQGTQTVSITYGGKSATFTVTVKPATLVSVAIKTKPNKTTYYVGDRLVTTGLSLTATYSNGTTKTIYSDFTCSPALLNTAGTQTVTVTYEGKTATFTVTVLASRQAPSPVQADVPKGTPLS